MPQKGSELDQSANIFITRDQFTIDPPSKISELKGHPDPCEDLHDFDLSSMLGKHQKRSEYGLRVILNDELRE